MNNQAEQTKSDGEKVARTDLANIGAPSKRRKRRFSWRWSWEVLSHPLLSGLVAGLLAAALSAAYQERVVNKQIAHEDRQHEIERDQRRLAVAIVMAGELAEVRAFGEARSSALAEQVIARVASGWSIPTTAIAKWGSDDLSLFDKGFLETYGTLLNSVDAFNSHTKWVEAEYADRPLEYLSEADKARLKEAVSGVVVFGGALHDQLIAIYRTTE